MNTDELIKFAIDDKAADFADTFNNVMIDKLRDEKDNFISNYLDTEKEE